MNHPTCEIMMRFKIITIISLDSFLEDTLRFTKLQSLIDDILHRLKLIEIRGTLHFVTNYIVINRNLKIM